MAPQRGFKLNERIPFSLTAQQYNILIELLYRAVPAIPVVIDMMMQVQNYSAAESPPLNGAADSESAGTVQHLWPQTTDESVDGPNAA